MTSIKCTFHRYRCHDGTYEHYGKICKHHDNYYDEYDSGCDYADDRPYRAENGMITVPLQCRYSVREEVRFEKNVKWFELDNDSLTVGRMVIPVERIKYLCIDNEEVIGGKADD